MNLPKIETLLASSNKLKGNCSGIYYLFDGAELVYIGKGWNCLFRLAEHTRKDSDKVFTPWNYIPIESDGMRNELERELIQTYKPKYNKTFKIHCKLAPGDVG
jgi:excinuclease UvrABC nuclease subunit